MSERHGGLKPSLIMVKLGVMFFDKRMIRADLCKVNLVPDLLLRSEQHFKI